MKNIVSIVATISVVAPFLTAAAAAKEVTLTLNEQEQTALAQVLDQATRTGGLAVTQGTVYFYNKLQQAISAASAPAEPAKEAPKEPDPAK